MNIKPIMCILKVTITQIKTVTPVSKPHCNDFLHTLITKFPKSMVSLVLLYNL